MDVTKLLKGEPETHWYYVAVAGEDSQATVQIRTPSPKKIREIGKVSGSTKLTREITEEDLENKAFQDELADYMVIEWDKIISEGEPLPCTRENKSALMDNWLEFFTLILDVVNCSTTNARKARKADEKN